MFDLIPSGQPPLPDPESASPALLRRRALATVLDVLVVYFVLVTIVLASIIGIRSGWTRAETAWLFLGSFVLFVPLYLTYCFGLEWRFGQTPGKVWQGLVVTTPAGRRPDAMACAIRNLLRYVDFLPAGYLLGWLVARRSPRGQRLGDRVGGTLVARVASPDELGVDPDSVRTAVDERQPQ